MLFISPTIDSYIKVILISLSIQSLEKQILIIFTITQENILLIIMPSIIFF